LLATGSKFGTEIKDTLEGYAPNLIKNLDILKARTGGVADSKDIVGKQTKEFTQGAADKSKKAVRDLYAKAEAEAGDNLAGFNDDAMQFIAENKGVAGIDSLIKYAENLGAVTTRKAADGTDEIIANPVTFKTLQKLRTKASKAANSGGTEGYDAGQFKDIIDDVFEKQGGEGYRAAAGARRAHALQYESGPKVISDLLKKKAGSETDQALAYDHVVDKVLLTGARGADDVRKLYSFMVKDPETRSQGLQQIKNLRAATLEHLKDQATKGQSEFSPAALNKAIRAIGGEDKLRMVLGKKGYSELKNYQEAADILLNKEKSVLGGSETAGRLSLMGEALFEKLGKLPFYAGDVIKVTGKAAKTLTNARDAKNAMLPLDESALSQLQTVGRNALLESPKASAARQAAIITANRDNN
jgi:uncharacterized protein YbjQ (UPF0145 family)